MLTNAPTTEGIMNGGLVASVLVPVLVAALVFVWLQKRKK